jgi:predicted porin
MKKHLIAAAVAGALAVPAMAQVTVYGIIDSGIQSHDSGAASDAKATRSVNGALASPRLGFKGSEDLGGGMKANFVLEQSLTPSTGSGTGYSRGAWVGLSGGFGSFRIGQGDTTTTQDIDSKVTQAGNLGLRVKVAASTSNTNGELGGDQNDVFNYTTPNISGFQAQIGYRANGSADVTDGDDSITDIYVQYEAGPLGVYIGSTKEDAGTSVAKKDFTAIGVKYDFGMAKVGFTMSQADASATTNADDTKTTMVSLAVPVGSGLTAHLVYGKAELENNAGVEGSGYTVALTKAFSKRTTVYGAYTNTKSDANGSFSMTGVTAPTAGEDPSALTFGVMHSF